MARPIILTISLFVFLASCQGSQKSTDVGGSWSQGMQGLKKSFTALLPAIYSKKRFNNPDNRERIKKRIEELSANSHNVSDGAMKKKWPGSDPGIQVVAGRLDTEIKVAKDSFNAGNLEFARRTLKSVAKNCFFCHSQNNVGPQLHNTKMVLNTSELLKTERADLLVATRNFEEALKVLKSAMTDKSYTMSYPFEVERALRRYLALSTRVQKNPKEAIATLNTLLNKGVKPVYLRENIISWRDSLNTWAREIRRKKKKMSPLKEARTLIKRAQTLQEYPVDNSADVYYLRATNLMHDYLLQNPKKRDLAQALFLLGTSYEVLADIGLWDVSDIYYEACIRKMPHSQQSFQCYRRWEQRVYTGYSGSGGIYIPKMIRKRMADLKALAQPIKKK